MASNHKLGIKPYCAGGRQNSTKNSAEPVEIFQQKMRKKIIYSGVIVDLAKRKKLKELQILQLKMKDSESSWIFCKKVQKSCKRTKRSKWLTIRRSHESIITWC